MPYISAEDNRREKLRNGEPALNAGELNYRIFYYVKHYYSQTKIENIINQVHYYIERFLGDKPNYQRYNDMVGCLTLCAKEIKRRLKIDLRERFKKIIDNYDDEIAKYEDTKIQSNGDVE